MTKAFPRAMAIATVVVAGFIAAGQSLWPSDVPSKQAPAPGGVGVEPGPSDSGRDISLEGDNVLGTLHRAECHQVWGAPGAILSQMKAEDCWAIEVRPNASAVFMPGVSLEDPTRGFLAVQGRPVTPDSPDGEFVLDPGTGQVVIDYLSLDIACFTTADGHGWALPLHAPQIVARDDAPECPPAPHHRTGEVVDCDLERYPSRIPGQWDQCLALALSERELAWFFAKGTVDGVGAIRMYVPGATQSFGATNLTREPGSRLTIPGQPPTLEGSGAVHITKLTLDILCFDTERRGPGFIDFSSGSLHFPRSTPRCG